MDVITILFIALGLAMDAFAVSMAHGITLKNSRSGDALKLALSFCSFQAFIPLLGWLRGLSLSTIISVIDHWIAFGILTLIGCKMIYESLRMEMDQRKPKVLTVRTLLALSITTSIDALAVGVSFAFLQISVAIPVVVIGTVTFLLSLVGVSFGKKIGHFFEKKIEIVGGLTLILIGLKILLEHLL